MDFLYKELVVWQKAMELVRIVYQVSKRFLAIARGSLYESMTHLQIAQDLGYVNADTDVEPLAAEIARMLGSMLKKYGAVHCSPSPSTFT